MGGGDIGDMGLIPGLRRALEKEMATHSSILAQESHGQRSLVGCSPWGHKVSDMTEQLSTAQNRNRLTDMKNNLVVTKGEK